jgi:mannose-6-phosphate isomerase-like protein (cupin superfamily)
MSATATPSSATYARHYDTPPQLEEGPVKTWLTRGANFVVAVSKVKAGDVLKREHNADEYFVFLPDTAAEIEAGAERIEAGVETLSIVPPGNSIVTARGEGLVVRVFTTRAADLLAKSANQATYANGAPDCAPLVDWPEPVDGYHLRNYVLSEYAKEDSNMRVFRSRGLMVNVLAKRETARDVRALSPHSHVDFEQGSLAVSGTYVHHLRFPWGKDMTTWREDEHVEIGSPSLTVIPPKVIHTSRNIGDQTGWLIDIFSPPRMDFSLKPGMVCNADQYPMPPAKAS